MKEIIRKILREETKIDDVVYTTEPYQILRLLKSIIIFYIDLHKQ